MIFIARWLLGVLTSFLRHNVAGLLFHFLNQNQVPLGTLTAISETTAWALACAFSFCCRAAPRRRFGRQEPPTVPRAAPPDAPVAAFGALECAFKHRKVTQYARAMCIKTLTNLKAHGSRVCRVGNWHRGSHSCICGANMMTFECNLCVD